MTDKLVELAELAQGMSIEQLRLLPRFAEFLAKGEKETGEPIDNEG